MMDESGAGVRAQLILPGFDGFRVTEVRLAFTGRATLGPADEDLVRALILGEPVAVILRHGDLELEVPGEVARKAYQRGDTEAEALSVVTVRVADDDAPVPREREDAE